jgi:hypothetical protein
MIPLLAAPPAAGYFADKELQGLPDPVRRYFKAAIAPDTQLARAARLRMRGSIRLGGRWMPFRARQVLIPETGFQWTARVGGIIAGTDSYVSGKGLLDFKLLGMLTVAHGDGPDVSRSAAGRAAGEAVWVPTAMLPRFDVTWRADAPDRIEARPRLSNSPVSVAYQLNGEGMVTAVEFDRWGDPDGTGSWRLCPFGFTVTRSATFGGVTIPVAGRAGWYYGTDRWPEGEFFRLEISGYELITGGLNWPE